jgi:ubiquinone/menaquinone biosynthesis C-methylase UbiE
MSEHADFSGGIPVEYERGLGPVIFADYAKVMAERVAALKPSRVLETAAGTGIVTRQLRDMLPPATRLTGTDLNPPMLAVAGRKFGADENVVLQSADATDLPFADEAFDVVTCQFGVMFFPDRAKSYREARRVLASGRTFLFSVWDAHACNPFGRIAYEVGARFFPADPPQFYRIPFSAHDTGPIRTSLEAAGFTDIGTEVVRLDKQVGDFAAFARGIVHGNPLIEQVRTRGGVTPEAMVAATTEALQREFPTGRMPLQAIFFEAKRA